MAERLAGVFPYLVVAAMVVFVLNPLVRRLAALGLPRRLAATMAFAGAVALTATLVDLAIPVLINQGKSLTSSSPGLVRKGGTLFDGLSRSPSPLLPRAGPSLSAWLQSHAGSAPT